MTIPRDSDSLYHSDPLYRALAEEMRVYVDGDTTGHDRHHAWRVFRVGRRLAAEEGADEEIVCAAALTHDLHRVVDDGFVHPRETLPQIEAMLSTVGFPPDKLDAVLHCVAVHEEYPFEATPEPVDTLEAAVVQDADNLDAIGAVGIARTFAFGGAHGNPLWNPDADLEIGSPTAETYDKRDHSVCVIEHVHEKLLKLADAMNTDAGRAMARDRHEFLLAFVKRFEAEWHGKR